MQNTQILVGIDIGNRTHRVAIAGPEGLILEEFDLAHTGRGVSGLLRPPSGP